MVLCFGPPKQGVYIIIIICPVDIFVHVLFGHLVFSYIGSRGCQRSISVYLNHFQVVMCQNGYRNSIFVVRPIHGPTEVKARKLPTLLEGKALAVWLELSTKDQGNYDTVHDKLISK